MTADKLIRLLEHRVLYGAPPAHTGIGHPRIHGDKFKRWRPDYLVDTRPNVRVQRSQVGAASPVSMV